MDDLKNYKALFCAVIERAALDIVQKPEVKARIVSKKGDVYNYLYFTDKQSKKDIDEAYEFINSEMIELYVEFFDLQIPVDKMRRKCEESYNEKKLTFLCRREKASKYNNSK